jgi:hypothetical protein
MRRLIFAVLMATVPAVALSVEDIQTNPPASATEAEGLEAWSRVYEVTSHSRCSNCHTGPSDRPMWSGPSYGAEPRQHGMNIRAGESRIGAETLPCSTCHGAQNGEVPHSPPGNASGLMLAPVEAHWFGQSSRTICEQLRDPARNGGRTLNEVAQHLGHDLILRWAWAPGPGREPAPNSLQEHVDDLLIWGVAGAPCPQQ